MNNTLQPVGNRHLLDAFVFLSAGFTVTSFLHGLTVLGTLVSIVITCALGAYRLHDRIKYGPVRRGE